MESTEFEDILDDWFIESLKTYKDLHVYQLEHPTQVIEWTSKKTVCVAGFSSSRNEILELRLPLKLFADENKGLCAERDFKVIRGGFSDGPVRCLRHIPGTRCAVTNDGRSSDLQVWDLGGDDSNVIKKVETIAGEGKGSETGSRIAARPWPEPQVLHGARSGDVQLTQLTSGQTLYKLEADSADPLSSLQFVDDAVFVAGCLNGSVYVADTRAAGAPLLSPPPEPPGASGLWWTDASAGQQRSGCRLVRLSSSGQAVISDTRNLGEAVSRAQLDVQTHQPRPHDVRVSWAPTLADCVSVSGFGGAVQIYDTSAWTSERLDAQPLFQHRGHAVSSRPDAGCPPVTVTSHVWHPEWRRTLLSAASDGSLHVWDWVHPDGAAALRPTPDAK